MGREKNVGYIQISFKLKFDNEAILPFQTVVFLK